MNKPQNQNDYIRSLEYKLHNKFFDILNERLEDTAKLGEEVYTNKNLIKEFFKKVNMLRVKYGKHYLTNNTKLKIILLAVKKKLYSKYYSDLLNFINSYGVNKLSEEDRKEFFKLHNFCIENLETVFEEINGELSEGDLLPKITKLKKDKEQVEKMRGVGL